MKSIYNNTVGIFYAAFCGINQFLVQLINVDDVTGYCLFNTHELNAVKEITV